MKDRFMYYSEVVKKLRTDYAKHGNLIVAFDFDHTIYDFHKQGDLYPKAIKMLQYLSSYPKDFRLILFTAREGQELQFAKKHCKTLKIYPQYVNESFVMIGTRKPFFNILLDDKAGLYLTYYTLIQFLKLEKFPTNLHQYEL